MKCINDCNNFFDFQSNNSCIFSKISIAYNKNRIPFVGLLINCISARSASQMLSLKNEYDLRFLNVLIISLCKSSANDWFDTI